MPIGVMLGVLLKECRKAALDNVECKMEDSTVLKTMADGGAKLHAHGAAENESLVVERVNVVCTIQVGVSPTCFLAFAFPSRRWRRWFETEDWWPAASEHRRVCKDADNRCLQFLKKECDTTQREQLQNHRWILEP
jgi:hypothetical protein